MLSPSSLKSSHTKNIVVVFHIHPNRLLIWERTTFFSGAKNSTGPMKCKIGNGFRKALWFFDEGCIMHDKLDNLGATSRRNSKLTKINLKFSASRYKKKINGQSGVRFRNWKLFPTSDLQSGNAKERKGLKN